MIGLKLLIQLVNGGWGIMGGRRMVPSRQNGWVAGAMDDNAALERKLRAAQNRAALAELERARAEAEKAAAEAAAEEAKAAFCKCICKKKKKH
ncbi:hypothetical protein [Fictibacillus fluitans]|uniref:Uncharacterized protein n=1 Tax=Fictibacillus fluitans TaxID=3058422 RepID=A0ABT8I073_9BACL|nr:hypothetical protein [Fictibacillus sp. NE201]MDN4526440.1 hypothetical protein [Fictibacillus sp. NE201]